MDMNLLIIVIFIYLVGLFGFGRLGYKVSKTYSDIVSGSWNMGLWLLVGTFTATWVSAVSVMGFPGMLFGVGLVAISSVFGGYFFANTLMPILAYKLRRPSIPPATIPEYVRLRFEPHVKKSGLQVIGGLGMTLGYLAYVSIQISAFGILLSSITGWPYTACIFIFGVFVLYVAAGGTLSVSITDLFNSAIITIGAIIGAAFILPEAGGWTGMWETFLASTEPGIIGGDPIPEGQLGSLLGPFSLSGVIGLFIAAAVGGSLAPHWPSRMLYAKNVKTAIMLPIVAQIVICFVVFVALLISGVGGKVVVGSIDATDTDWIVPYVFMNYVPGLLGAIGIASLLAAAMSTANSMIFHGALAAIYDVFRTLKGESYPEETLRKWTRILVVVVGVVSILFAIDPPEFIGIMSAKVFGFWGATFFVPMYIGLYWKRLNRQGVYFAMLAGPAIYLLFDYLIAEGMMWPVIPAIVWAVVIAVTGAVILSYVYPPSPKVGWQPFFEKEEDDETKRVWNRVREDMVKK